MTGVEAVSNGVQAFRDDVVRTARATLTVIIAILMFMLLGIAWLSQAYGIVATTPGGSGYQSVLSQLLSAVGGRGAFYYISMGSILAVLSLSANTSFADFPRVCHAVASDRYLPYGFTMRGRRLVYSKGIYALALLAGLLLVAFGGVTDRLIPLFAVGAFLAFTLSQAGMVAHWRKQADAPWWSQAVNGFGAMATGLTLAIVIAAKFTEGAWLTLIAIPGLVAVMMAVGRHYRDIRNEIADSTPLSADGLKPPLALVPIDDWNMVSEKALRFAMSITPDVQALHIETGESAASLKARWKDLAEQPAAASGKLAPKLVALPSPYRLVVTPILKYARQQQQEHPDRKIAVVVAELRERHWYHFFLHNQRGEALTAMLMLSGDRRIVVINVPWYVDC